MIFMQSSVIYIVVIDGGWNFLRTLRMIKYRKFKISFRNFFSIKYSHLPLNVGYVFVKDCKGIL